MADEHQPRADAHDRRRARKPGERSSPPVEQDGRVWRIRSLAASRQVLRARAETTQAGFTAERIPRGVFTKHPILISDGPAHDDQRSKVARFFAPAVVERYIPRMESCADRLLDEVDGSFELDELALLYTVEVTADIVGLTAAPVPRLARRLVSFFNQPPFDITRPDLGRTPRQWASAAVNGIVPVVRLWLADVRPAVRARRRSPTGDVISHLIAEGYSDADILVECVTYGTAGMVTTREFIAMAAWHLLRDDALRERYVTGEQAERYAILHEVIRLEPVVGHLYRRVQQAFEVGDGDEQVTVQPGDLLDVCVRAANADPEAVGTDPLDLCPHRPLPAGVAPYGLTFGDGAHKCPGQPLAILESDVLLTRLLARRPVLLREPTLDWDDLIEGYRVRGLELRLGASADGAGSA
ncbi:MAG: cytochrome P450 [Actinobacteria bacterium]|nr:cytochrome P450 [Actinomycetota bacterium]